MPSDLNSPETEPTPASPSEAGQGLPDSYSSGSTEEMLHPSESTQAEAASKLPGGPVSQVRLSFHLAPGTRVRVIARARNATAGEPAVSMNVQRTSESDLPPVSVEGATPVEASPLGQVLFPGAPTPAVAVPPRRKDSPSAPPSSTAVAPLWGRISSGWAEQGRTWPLSLPVTLFALAVVVYLAVRLIGLTQYPVYFFTDEAIHSVSAADLIHHGWRDPEGTLLPPYFKNGTYYNLGTSVYVQVIPYLLFGFSAYAVRATSMLFTLLAVVGIGVMLKKVFKITYWWAGVLLLSIMPAWFLHSRTAFETVLFVAFYGGMLCCYLLYRYRSPNYIYPTLVLAGLAFYAYSPGQAVIAITGVLLGLSDLPYHFRELLPHSYPKVVRLTIVALLLSLIFTPYVRQTQIHPSSAFNHLRDLNSYWVQPGEFSGKLAHFVKEYFYGLSPEYWYVPNVTDLARHEMDSYGNLLIGTLPFALLGLAMALRQWRSSAHRAILIALLAAPAGAALVGIGITRVLVFVIPSTILTAMGLSAVIDWLRDPKAQLSALGVPPHLGWWRVVGGIMLPLAGIAALFYSGLSLSGRALFFLTLMLAVDVWGLLPRLAGRLQQQPPTHLLNKILSRWQAAPAVLSIALFGVLAIANFAMLRDALVNGPFWVQDYGMGGVQYGAYQIFPKVKAYLEKYPDRQIIFSPNWANGTDVVAEFFLGDPLPMRMGSVEGHIIDKLPLDENITFVMTPEDLKKAEDSGKFAEIVIEKDGVVLCPNGEPCFYFAQLRYVDNVDELFAAEKEARHQLQETPLTIDGQPVKVRYSAIDSGSIDQIFDGNPNTLARSMEANPLVIDLEFSSPRTIGGASVIIGSINADITVRLYTSAADTPVEYHIRGRGTVDHPELSQDFPASVAATRVTFEIRDVDAPEPSHTHVWEITLR